MSATTTEGLEPGPVMETVDKDSVVAGLQSTSAGFHC